MDSMKHKVDILINSYQETAGVKPVVVILSKDNYGQLEQELGDVSYRSLTYRGVIIREGE